MSKQRKGNEMNEKMKWYGCYCNEELLAVAQISEPPVDNPETLLTYSHD